MAVQELWAVYLQGQREPIYIPRSVDGDLPGKIVNACAEIPGAALERPAFHVMTNQALFNCRWVLACIPVRKSGLLVSVPEE